MIANDLEPSAVESIRKNVEWNELGPKPIPKHLESMGETRLSQQQKQELNVTELGKVRPNEGDAWLVFRSLFPA